MSLSCGMRPLTMLRQPDEFSRSLLSAESEIDGECAKKRANLTKLLRCEANALTDGENFFACYSTEFERPAEL